MSDSWKGSRIASFRIPQPTWQIAARVIAIACLLVGLVLYGSGLPLLRPLLWIGVIGVVSGNRYIRFYEKGISIPKAAGEVFLSRDQLLQIKLDHDRFLVIGPDASWGGPYSGGSFRIRNQDLPNLHATVAGFLHP